MSWIAWQLADSAFPTGAFAHSSGLEATWQAGLLGDLKEFVASFLHQQATTALPVIAAVNHDPRVVAEADALWEAITTNHVANRASRGIGQAMLATAAKGLGCEALVVARRELRLRSAPCHQPVVFGLVTGLLGMPADEAQALYVFTAVRDVVSSMSDGSQRQLGYTVRYRAVRST